MILCYSYLMRIMGIDYGTKRVGIALSDPTRTLALPFGVINNSSKLTKEILNIIQLNEVDLVVVGESKDYSGKPNAIFTAVNELANILKEKGLEVQLEPEFMTSVQAERLQGKNDKNDASAAAIILQSYIDRIKNK